MRQILICLILYITMTTGCTSKQQADLFVYNATIYTVDPAFSKVSAMVIKDGKILATGDKDKLQHQYECKEMLDAKGKYIYPGFIDAHAHFIGYAQSLIGIDLVGTQSWDEVLQRVVNLADTQDKNSWIIGRGWDQNDWQEKEFPTNEKLNELFPDRPVYLIRIDGHAAIANNKALEIAGIQPGDTISGGSFLTHQDKLTGVLIDNAMDKVVAHIPEPTTIQLERALLRAQQNCFSVGLTTLHDCGLNYETIEAIKSLQDKRTVKIRLYALLSDNKKNYDYLLRNGIIKTSHLHVRGFKLFSDGALGSRGASLLEDYSDQPGWKGFLLSNAEHFDSIAALIAQHNWQMCTHAIGDNGNRVMLQIYAKYLKGKNDLRWRIEHAQVVNKDDFHYFGDYNIVPSVQPTHATSDMYWAGDRLGVERLKSAYAYKQLLEQNGWIPLGTDFPVEDISPFKTFYAAVVRKDAQGFPETGFQKENALTREQALRGMTIWAAKAAFEENEKGSLEPGKVADFVILDNDLMHVSEHELLQLRVWRTYLGGAMVYSR